MTGTRTFHLGDILTITTGRLVSPRHIDGVYDLLNWMTGDNLFTHQLPRGADECAGPLLAQHPDLAAVTVPDDFTGKEHVEAWLAEQVAVYGETREVAPLAAEEHTHIDALTELRKMAPHAEIITVEVPGKPAGHPMSLPPTKVRVTQEHIDRGKAEDDCCCPIALAIREQGGYDKGRVHVSNDGVRLLGRYQATLPPAAQRFIEDFDQSGNADNVGPIEFELEWETVIVP